MKTPFALLFICISVFGFAQPPQAINYQASVRDVAGNPLANHNVALLFSVLDSSASGPMLYQETFSTTTDDGGIFSVEIGRGTPVSGSFNTIGWARGSKWLKTEIDTAGGTNYILMGTSEFLSVPYALYAGKSKDNLSGFGDPDTTYHLDTTYMATSDGFLTIYLGINWSGNCALGLRLYSDSSSTPTFILGRFYDASGYAYSHSYPIKKNNYWQIATAGCILPDAVIIWTPLR